MLLYMYIIIELSLIIATTFSIIRSPVKLSPEIFEILQKTQDKQYM